MPPNTRLLFLTTFMVLLLLLCLIYHSFANPETMTGIQMATFVIGAVTVALLKAYTLLGSIFRYGQKLLVVDDRAEIWDGEISREKVMQRRRD